MVEADLHFVTSLLASKVLRGPVLELGVGYGGKTCRAVIEGASLEYVGTDLQPGASVDVVANFESVEDLEVFDRFGAFGAILILNVLEHTFDPIRILDNASRLLAPGGCLVIVTPTVWPLHNYPMDASRILPNFYEEYASRRGLLLDGDHFEYVGAGPVRAFKGADGSYKLPPPVAGGWQRLVDRGVHRAFNTFGRGMFHPSHLAVGAVLRRNDAPRLVASEIA